jgi:hypothetical protein
MAWKRLLVGAGILLALYAAYWLLLRGPFELPPYAFLAVLLVVPVAMRIVMDDTEAKVNRAARGARGEERVGDLLAQLGEEYHVIHDVVVGRGNIDHVVVGPTGIFVIETKSHGGKVTEQNGQLRLNGRPLEKDFLAQGYAEAMALKEYLRKVSGKDFYVVPYVVFTAAFVTVRGTPKGVGVIPGKWLVERIEQGRGHLSPDETTRIARALATVTDEARRATY